MITAINGVMKAIPANPDVLESPQFGLGNLRAYSYPKARVTYITYDSKRGLEAQISFPPPLSTRKKSSSERRKWWDTSKRLEEGILICLLLKHDTICSLMFFIVTQKDTDPGHDYSLSSTSSQSTIRAELRLSKTGRFRAADKLVLSQFTGLVDGVSGNHTRHLRPRFGEYTRNAAFE